MKRTQVLLVGHPGFCRSLVGPLRQARADVVGLEHTGESAVRAAAALGADLILLENGMLDIAHRLSEWASVVIVSGPSDGFELHSREAGVAANGAEFVPLAMNLALMAAPASPSSAELA